MEKLVKFLQRFKFKKKQPFKLKKNGKLLIAKNDVERL